MNKRNWMFRSILLLLVVGQILSLNAQDKIAILMGVEVYPSSSIGPSTHVYNDLNLIKETLIKQGFLPTLIYTFLDSVCSRNGILEVFNSFLIPKLKEGMCIYFHFSGRGQRVIDIDGDESDGIDEAIVPFDAPEKNEKNTYNAESFILDDELEHFFAQIQRKIGPQGQLLVIIDAVTYPSNLKGRVTARGSVQKMEVVKSEESSVDESNSFFSSLTTLPGQAPLVSIYNADSNQFSEEFQSDDHESFGLFTYTLCKIFLQLKANTTFKDLTKKLKAAMNDNDMAPPIFLGDAQQVVFNGQLVGNNDHFEIKKIYSKDLVLINGGQLQQIEKGTEFLLYAETVIDTAGIKPIGRAVVVASSMLESELKILESQVNQVSRNTKFFISRYHFKPLSISLQINLNGSDLEQKLKTHFAFSPFIKQNAIQSELRIVQTKNNLLNLETKQGEVLYQKALKDLNTFEILFTLNEKIAEYLRANFLRNLEIDNAGKNSSIQCILVKDENEFLLEGLKNKVQIGSRMKIRLTNHSDRRQYFGIIDIQPDHKINVLIPYDKPAEEYYIEAGQSYTTDFELEVSPPLGRDVIKVIFMSTPLDLRSVIATRGVSNLLNPKAKNPFETLLGNTFIEHPITSGEALKINVSEIGNMTGMILEITEVQ